MLRNELNRDETLLSERVHFGNMMPPGCRFRTSKTSKKRRSDGRDPLFRFLDVEIKHISAMRRRHVEHVGLRSLEKPPPNMTKLVERSHHNPTLSSERGRCQVTFPDSVGRSAEELGSFRGEGDSIQKARLNGLCFCSRAHFLLAWVSRTRCVQAKYLDCE
jgi:hypothetical protein